MDTDSFELVLGEWIESRLGTGEEAIAVGRKALRGIHRDQTCGGLNHRGQAWRPQGTSQTVGYGYVEDIPGLDSGR